MKCYKTYIGIDISKLKLDVSFICEAAQKEHDHLILTNDSKGLQELLKSIKRRHLYPSDVLICFENTGVYGMPLSVFLSRNHVDFCMVAALEIKRAKGITRGKSDKTDARDIAFYAITHRHKLSLYRLPETDILKMQLLYNQREKLMKAIHALSMTEENNGFLPKEIIKEVKAINASSIKNLKEAVAEIESRLMQIIEENKSIKQQYDLATSVPGVGQQVAIAIILTTKCFTAFNKWRQMACYAGVAPFEYSSGSSIKGKNKVHPMANKKIKALLHLSALTAKRCDKEIAAYYQRKVDEGKNPMSVMNAIRCKVLSRVFATVQRGTPYVNIQKFVA